MSGFPVLLEGAAIEALVVGGGRVATRKALALLDAGASVRVVAPTVSDELRAAAVRSSRLGIELRAYSATDIGGAQLVVAATDRRAINADIARDARAACRLVNVADVPDEGNFITVAMHRAGELVIAVSAGGVPAAARAIRDAIAERFDDRYAVALDALRAARRSLIAAGRADDWHSLGEELVAGNFCALVEHGELAARMDAWR